MNEVGPVRQGRERDAERLKFFTDAVVAIALTLLILPLMEAVSASTGQSLTTSELLDEHGPQVVSFFISFAVIAVFWTVHHRTYEHVARYNGLLLWLNLLWMLTIVLLPVTTAMTGSMKVDSLQALLYIRDMMLSSLVLFAMSLIVYRTSSLGNLDDPIHVGSLTATALMTVLYALALVISVLWPGVGYASLLLLSLTPVLQKLITPRVTRRLVEAGSGALQQG